MVSGNQAASALRLPVEGRSARLLQVPDTCRAMIDRIRRKLEAWEPFRDEVLNYRKDGMPFWVELNVRPSPTRQAFIRLGYRCSAT